MSESSIHNQTMPNIKKIILFGFVASICQLYFVMSSGTFSLIFPSKGADEINQNKLFITKNNSTNSW